MVSFRLHTCSTGLLRRTTIPLFTNHNVTACQSTRGLQERTPNPCQQSLYNIGSNNVLRTIYGAPGIRAGWLCLHTIRSWPQGTIPPSLCLLTWLSLLLGAWGALSRECWQGREFLQLSRLSLDSCAVPAIKRPCAIFWLGGISDKLQTRKYVELKNNKTKRFSSFLTVKKDRWQPTNPHYITMPHSWPRTDLNPFTAWP